jgi:hypothetical protein
MSSAIDGYFMSILAPQYSESKSFEEIRIDDYIKAYRSTGRPPQPCSQEPEDESQRKSLNLPPLFKPHPIRNATLTINGLDNSTTDVQLNLPERITNPAKLPSGQEFRVHSASGETYHCISCMPQYTNFSQEELQYYAYLAGNIKPPVSVVMDPFIRTMKDTSASEAHLLVEDQLQSISAQPQYAKHSHEELRVAFLLFGREMTSAELQNPSAIPPPPSKPIVTIPGRPIPPPAFAAPTSAPIPKFSFGLR